MAAKGKKRKDETKPTGSAEIIDMQEAIMLLKTSRPTFYRWLRSGKIDGMKVGRQWRFYRSEIERFMKGDAPRIDLTASIEPLIKDLMKRAKALGMKGVVPKGTHPLDEAIRLMILIGIRLKASDIHLDLASGCMPGPVIMPPPGPGAGDLDGLGQRVVHTGTLVQALHKTCQEEVTTAHRGKDLVRLGAACLPGPGARDQHGSELAATHQDHVHSVQQFAGCFCQRGRRVSDRSSQQLI